ncbi:4Fe-4S dicluster domain-containing protein [Desulfovibrio mangrovi]|uniref:4Fe-4S dicluster domain-containing protein n=1 Tax=Desulfovibrio mangrovi TaxID=2976983 RepID=UPI0022460A37|nr:4Fe-4S dicluster domain-containing protein [Desulfovibrio mangrovi]UZP68131.1 4Fe-4S dicluster domain-containing protein [Desulfovibrio mangrovi]
MVQHTQELRKLIAQALPELDVVLAWTSGSNQLASAPLFITAEDDLDKLDFGPMHVQNLAAYLPSLKGRKVGIVTRGCDSRTIIELLQEKLINRDEITIFGIPCTGAVNIRKVREAADGQRLRSVEAGKDIVSVTTDEGVRTIPMQDVLMEKCYNCPSQTPLIHDHMVTERNGCHMTGEAPESTLDKLDAMEPDARFAFWEESMDRCIRCYACRNACPLCVCKDSCVAQSRDPHWVDLSDNPREKLMFQAIHALHTAGRCTECGECERACPMGIPILAMKQALNRRIKHLFDYEAGMDMENTPPLFMFRQQEEHIKERDAR